MDKKQALRMMGCLNPRPADVKAEMFQGREFFDPCDKVQVKYEMLRAVQVDGISVTDVARAPGFHTAASTPPLP